MLQIEVPVCRPYAIKFKTDFGWMRPISDGNNLIQLDWNQSGWNEPDCPDDVSRETKSQLQAFLAGKLHQFTLSLAPIGKTAAAHHWLDTMIKIPYGTVVTYTEFAALAGKPGASRAAGSSCANNPIPIIYPCHRVIRADRTLGLYSGGNDYQSTYDTNLARKTALLLLETTSTISIG